MRMPMKPQAIDVRAPTKNAMVVYGKLLPIYSAVKKIIIAKPVMKQVK